MWRSSLTRSHPFLSHLRRSTGCGAGRQAYVAAALGSANRRPYASDTAEVGGAKPWPRPRQHLYVVLLDEMNTGRSIYKLNLDDLDGGDEDAVAAAGMDNSKTGRHSRRRAASPIRSSASAFRPTVHAHTWKPSATRSSSRGEHATVGYSPSSTTPRWHGWTSSSLRRKNDEWEWVWRTSPSPLTGKSYVNDSFVRSYVVHPDGRTIFVSCAFAYRDPEVFTYSLDKQHGESTRRGDGSLPFNGQAYYDRHLETWIGIREANGADGGKERRPYLCFCDVPDLADGEQPRKHLSAPEWKMFKEELTFFEDASNQGLVHTGRGRFCLIETKPAGPLAEEDEDSQCTCCDNGVDEYLLRVTMFCAKHDKNGELVVSRCRPGRSYLAPNYAPDLFSAFWM
ncbi:unnamed protein product [Alopecurus aequalis]